MGIPTVKRDKKNYLIDTLHSLLYELSEEQKKDCIIIIFIAEVSLHGKVQSADRKHGDLCLNVMVQNTVGLVFGRDFFRAGGDGEQLMPQCSYVGKKACTADDQRVKVILHLPTVVGSDVSSEPI